MSRVLLADEHLMVAQGIRRLLMDCYESVGLVFSGEELIESVSRNGADVVVSDISMPDVDGIEAMRRLRAQGHTVPFVFLSMQVDSDIAVDAIRAGASGYVSKSSAGEELVRAIREVLAGRTYVTPTIAAQVIAAERPRFSLTEKQLRVLGMVAQGLRSKQIAHELGVSVRTIESHKYAIMQELDVHGTVELVRKAERARLI